MTASVAGTELDLLWRAAEGACARGPEVVARAQAGRAPGAEREAGRKGPGDRVTAVDQESERAIRDFLAKATPAIPVLGERAAAKPATGTGPWTRSTERRAFSSAFRRWRSRSGWWRTASRRWA